MWNEPFGCKVKSPTQLWNRILSYPEIEFDSLSNLLSEVSKFRSETKFNQCWYRSQRRSGWPLLPSALRKATGENISDAKLKEREMLFGNRGRQRLSSFFKIEKDDFTGWLTTLQHHGVPTRLMDWSESLAVSLHFISGFRDGDQPTIFVLDPIKLNYLSSQNQKRRIQQVLGADSSLVSELCRLGFDPENQGCPSFPVAFFPRHIDVRMVAQNACFTVHGSSCKSLEDLVLSFGKNATKALVKLVLKKGNEPSFREELELVCPTTPTVMPDLAGGITEVIGDARKIDWK